LRTIGGGVGTMSFIYDIGFTIYELV